MGLFGAFADFLKGPVGNGLQNDPADVRNTKRNLNRIGFFDDEVENDFITRELDTGIRDFQRDNDLSIDGRLFPGGETERSIFYTLEQRDPDPFFGRSDDDGQSIGFGGNVSGTFERKPRESRQPIFSSAFENPFEEARPAIARDPDFAFSFDRGFENPIARPAFPDITDDFRPDEDGRFPGEPRTMEFRPGRDDVPPLEPQTLEIIDPRDLFDRDFDPLKDSIDGLGRRPLIDFLPGFREDRAPEDRPDILRDPLTVLLDPLRLEDSIRNGRENNQDDVLRLQRRLGVLGLIPGETLRDPTGILDRETSDGIKNFQRMLGLKMDGLVTPDGETAQGLEAISNVLKAGPFAGMSAEERQALGDQQRAAIVGQAVGFVKGIVDAVKDKGSTADKINAFAPVVSLGLGALAGVPGIGQVPEVASQAFSGAQSFFNVKDALDSDGDVLQKINQILPAVASGANAAAGLAGSVGNALSSAGNAIGEEFGNLFSGDTAGQTGLSAGDVTQGIGNTQIASGRTAGGTGSFNKDAILEQVRLQQNADAKSLAETGRISRSDSFVSEGAFALRGQASDDSLFGGAGNDRLQTVTPPIPGRKPEFDATGRMIRDNTPPIPQRKPVVPELSRPSFDLKKAPVFNNGKIRQEILLNNDPAKFEIKDNPDLKPDPVEIGKRLFKDKNVANKTVQEHDATIKRLAKKHGVDPDMVRAIMWTENARGDKGGLNRLADSVGLSNSQTPMNINGDIWRPLIDKEQGPLNNPEENIEAGVILIKRISDRIENPTPAKIGSVWNFTGRELTSFFGEAIGRAFTEKPWQKKR